MSNHHPSMVTSANGVAGFYAGSCSKRFLMKWCSARAAHVADVSASHELLAECTQNFKSFLSGELTAVPHA